MTLNQMLNLVTNVSLVFFSSSTKADWIYVGASPFKSTLSAVFYAFR